MRAAPTSAFARAQTWLVVALTVVLLVPGTFWYGWSVEIHRRFWTNIFERIDGPMTFRFYLQPLMAALAALPDGIRDARLGRKSFFWSALWDRNATIGRLREGIVSTARVVLLGISMDVIYQFRVLDRFYPGEALMMAILLVIIPYFIFRWIIERIANWWFMRKGAGALR
jgi:hypothetical protein